MPAADQFAAWPRSRYYQRVREPNTSNLRGLRTMRRPILAVVTTTKSRLMQCKGASALIAALFWTALPAFGHDASESSDLSSDAGRSHVTIKTEGDKRVIESNGLPDHKTGQFPN